MEIKARIEGKHALAEDMLKVPVLLTKEFTFDSAHHLTPYDGKCSFSHGHTYKLQVTIAGIPDVETGLLMDFGEMKEIVKTYIDEMDHNYLNSYFTFSSTCENLVRWLWQTLSVAFPPDIALARLQLWETPTSYAMLTASMVGGASE